MRNLYHCFEFSLILLILFRIFWEVNRNDKHFDFRFLEVFLYYLIIFLNYVFFWLKLDNRFAFYFVHCCFPVALSAVVVKKHVDVSFFLFLGVLIILNNLLLNYGFIILSYLFLFFIMSNRIYKFSMMSKNFREKIPVYVSILAVLIISHLIFLMSIVKVDWHASRPLDYFLFLTQFIFLSSIIIGHVHLRRFIVD
jgi:hypothetical protein